WLPWGLTVIAFATAAVFAWRSYRLSPTDGASGSDSATGGNAAPTKSFDQSGGPPVAAGEVALDNKGIVTAPHQIQISPQVGGEIVWLDPDFREGAVYKKGDPLAVIDPVI